MEIIYVLIGIALAVLFTGLGVCIGITTNVSKFYGASLSVVQKTDKMLDPMCDFYLKMMREYEKED